MSEIGKHIQEIRLAVYNKVTTENITYFQTQEYKDLVCLCKEKEEYLKYILDKFERFDKISEFLAHIVLESLNIKVSKNSDSPILHELIRSYLRNRKWKLIN